MRILMQNLKTSSSHLPENAMWRIKSQQDLRNKEALSTTTMVNMKI